MPILRSMQHTHVPEMLIEQLINYMMSRAPDSFQLALRNWPQMSTPSMCIPILSKRRKDLCVKKLEDKINHINTSALRLLSKFIEREKVRFKSKEFSLKVVFF